MSQLAEDLRAAKTTLVSRGRCAKGAQDLAKGTHCPIMAIAEGVFCGYDSIATVERSQELHGRCLDAELALVGALPEAYRTKGYVGAIIEWNENPETTDADVFAAFDRAIAKAEEVRP